MITSDYLKPALSHDMLKECVDAIVKRARKMNVEFDAVAFRGMSGALVAPAVAMRLKKTLLMVRKDIANTHSSKLVEGKVETAYIIVDDLISSGQTIVETVKAIKSFNRKAKCVATMLYNQDGSGCVSGKFVKSCKDMPVHFCRFISKNHRVAFALPWKTTAKAMQK